jgi:spore germination protein
MKEEKKILVIGIIILIIILIIPHSTHKEIQGFYPLNANQSDWNNIRFDLLSTLTLYFIHPTIDGGIDISDHIVPTDLIKLAHKNNAKVVISIQPTESSTIDAILTTSKASFLDNLSRFVQRNNFDGADIDIENISEINSITGEDNKLLMTNFMRDLSIKLWGINPNYRISIDVNGDYNTNIFDLTAIQNYVNYIMVMGYDYHWSGGETAGSVSPIYSYDSGPSIRESIDYYSNVVNKDKLLLGVPYYGLEWNTKNGDIESPALSQGIYYIYQDMKDRASKYGRIWDDTWKTPWYKYQVGDVWHQGHYDDAQSLAIKYDLVNSANIAGIGIWEVEYGSNESELWQLIQNKFGRRKR